MPCCNTARYNRLQRVLYRPCSYTTHATKQHTELCSGFSCDYASSTARDTRPAQAAIIPPAPRWSIYQCPDGLHRYQIPAPRRTLHSSAQTAYYNNVYKGAGVRTCTRSARRRLDASHARRLAIWHRVSPAPSGPAEQSSSRGAAGGAEPLAATAASLFGLSPDS